MVDHFKTSVRGLLQKGLLFQDEANFLLSTGVEKCPNFAKGFSEKYRQKKTEGTAIFALFQFLAQYHCIHKGEMMESIDIEGLLHMRVDKKWKSRFFVLQGFALEGYERIGDIKPREIFNLSPEMILRDVPASLGRPGFEIISSRDVTVFTTVNDEARMQWIVSCARAIVAPRLIHLKAPLAFISTPIDIKRQMNTSENEKKTETGDKTFDKADMNSTVLAARATIDNADKNTRGSPFLNSSPTKSGRKTLRKTLKIPKIGGSETKDESKEGDSEADNNEESLSLIEAVRMTGLLMKATICSSRDEKLNSKTALNKLASTIRQQGFRSKKPAEVSAGVDSHLSNESQLGTYNDGKNNIAYNATPKMKMRFFVLEHNLLSYYASKKQFDQGMIPTGQLFLPSDCTVIREYEGFETTFDIITARRTLRLLASDQKEKSQWVNAIEKVLLLGRARNALYESFRAANKPGAMVQYMNGPFKRVQGKTEDKVEVWVTSNFKKGEKVGEIYAERDILPVDLRSEIYKQLGENAPAKFTFCRKQEGLQRELFKAARLSLYFKDFEKAKELEKASSSEENSVFGYVYTNVSRDQEKEHINLKVDLDDIELPVILLNTSGWEGRTRKELIEEMRLMEAKIAELERKLAEKKKRFSIGSLMENEIEISALAASLYRLQGDGYLDTSIPIDELEKKYNVLFDPQDLNRLFINAESPFRLTYQKLSNEPEKIRLLLDNLQKIFIKYNLFGSRLSAPWWKRKLKDPKMYMHPEKLFAWAKTEPWCEDEIERSFYLTTKQRGKVLKSAQTFIVRPIPDPKKSQRSGGNLPNLPPKPEKIKKGSRNRYKKIKSKQTNRAAAKIVQSTEEGPKSVSTDQTNKNDSKETKRGMPKGLLESLSTASRSELM